MILAIDGYEANSSGRVGIGRFAYEIIIRINALVDTDPRYQSISVRVYIPNTIMHDLPGESARWKYRISPLKPFWTFLGLPLSLLIDSPKADVIFSPTHYVPRFTTISKICAVMDMSFENYPELFKWGDLYKLKNWTRYSVTHAQHVLTISEFSKNAIIESYGIAPNRVTVVYPGITEFENVAYMPKSVLIHKYSLSPNYVFSVGTLQPRKNFVRLIEAFSTILQRNQPEFIDLQLVIVGKKGWLYDEILAAPERYSIETRVKFLNFVHDDDLKYLYKYALTFVLPSLYEGFGLPVAEAMSQGCPVVVSQTSSLPEIAGKAGVYIDPEDVGSIAKGLLIALGERTQKQGKYRINQGLERVKEFNWDSAAKQVLDIFQDVGPKNI